MADIDEVIDETIDNAGDTTEGTDVDNETGSDIVEVELSEEDKRKLVIMRHAYQKLDNLPLGFGLPAYSDDIDNETIMRNFSVDLLDTLRETGIPIDSIEEDSYDEMMIENRVVYYALKRFRLTASTFFKFSTATDGKTVDKTNIPKMLQQIISEYDNEYKKWKSKGIGNIWNRTATLNYSNV